MEGEQLGIVNIRTALQMAEEAGVDLVEIALEDAQQRRLQRQHIERQATLIAAISRAAVLRQDRFRLVFFKTE